MCQQVQPVQPIGVARMLRPLKDLDCACRDIDAEWRRSDHDVEAFPEIVLRGTNGLDLAFFGELANITQLLEDPYVAHLQKLSSFSDVYLLLWHNSRFHVEVLNWWGSDIN